MELAGIPVPSPPQREGDESSSEDSSSEDDSMEMDAPAPSIVPATKPEPPVLDQDIVQRHMSMTR